MPAQVSGRTATQSMKSDQDDGDSEIRGGLAAPQMRAGAAWWGGLARQRMRLLPVLVDLTTTLAETASADYRDLKLVHFAAAISVPSV